MPVTHSSTRAIPITVPAPQPPATPQATSMTSKPPSPAIVRSALPGDEPMICRLVNAWADEGLTLRRTPEEITANLGEFVVAELPGESGSPPVIVACGALAVFSPSLAEIRSVAVDPGCKGTGAGRKVVEFLVDIAMLLELDEVCLLTKVPGFFERFGFRTIEPDELPSAFIDEAIAGRGRTIVGRTIMLRELLR